eukprot:448546-Ditylum_brightwellii.AAC.1
MKKESHNSLAFQDYCRKVGIPHSLKADNAQSDLGENWTSYCRKHCIKQLTTKLHHPQQNLAELTVGNLCLITKNVITQFNVPTN